MRSSTARSGSQSTDDRRSVVSGNSSTASTLVPDSLASGKTATSQLRKFTAGVGRPGLAREARDAVRAALVAQNPLRKAPISEPVDYEKFINERSIQLENDAQREIVLFPRDDIEECSSVQECETAIPMVKPSDIKQAKWLLTREALRFYTTSQRSIVFNYSKFSGDYSANNTAEMSSFLLIAPQVPQPILAPKAPQPILAPKAPQPILAPQVPQPIQAPQVPQPILTPQAPQPIQAPQVPQPILTPQAPQPIQAPQAPQPILAPQVPQPIQAPQVPQPILTPQAPQTINETLSSLVFESDMALEDERAAYGVTTNGWIGVVKEGNLNVVKSDAPTLFDNLKSSSSKRRYCILRRLEGGESTFEIRKLPQEAPKIAPLKVTTAQIKSTKKGKTVLEIRGGDEKCVLLESEETQMLEEWLVALQTAIAFANKEDALSICSELDTKGSKSGDMNTVATSSSSSAIKSKGADTESIGSEDSSNSHKWAESKCLQYPSQSNFFSCRYDSQKAFSKARNISCTVRFVRGEEAIPEKAMVDRMSPAGPYCISSTCSIQHHQQNPVFGEEMKTQLPLNLTTSDHLLFSFSHISVAGNSSVKSSESTETPIGYSWLPLVWKKDRLIMESDEQEFALPVAIDLPQNYYRLKPTGMAGKGEDSQSEVRWVDQKPLFRVRLRLVSSVFTTDPKLQTFFQACDRLSAKGIIGDAADSLKRMVKSKSSSPSGDILSSSHPRSCSPIADSMQRSMSLEDEHPHMKHLLHSIRLLSDVPFDRLLVFLPIVLGRLFAILPQAPTEQLAVATLRSIISICDMCHQNGRARVVRRFVKSNFADAAAREQFVSHEATIYSVICRHLPTLMREMQSESPDELGQLYRQLWVLTDAIIKSMAQTMCSEQLNKISQRDRFPTEVLEQMGLILDVGVQQIVTKHKEMKDESRCANLAFAYLARFALNFVDRGVVFRWIHNYISRLDDTDFRALRDYKTDFLEILCLHEHHVPLNLPVLINGASQIQRLNYSGGVVDTQLQTTNASGSGFLSRFFNQIFNTPTLETNETDRYASCSGEWHLSPSFAQNHFIVGLLMQELVACIRETKDYRKRPILLLRNLLAKHSFDRRYGDMTIQRRIAMLYAPVLTFALDHLHEFVSEEFEDVDATPTGYRSFPTAHTQTIASSVSAKSMSKFRSVTNRYTEVNQFSRGSPVRTSSPVPSTHSTMTTSRPPQMPPPPPLGASNGAGGGQKTSSTPLVEKLTEDEIQDILICCVFILQRMPKRILAALWTENDGANAEKMIRLLELIVDVFRYRGKEHALRRTAANSKTRSLFTLNLPSARVSSTTPNRQSAEMMMGDDDPNASGSTNSIPFRVLQLVNLSQEVALIVLDVAQTFAHQLAASQRHHRHWPHSETLFHSLLSLHLRLCDDHWSECVRLHVIAGLALFVNLFRTRLFEGGPLEPLYMLIEKVLIQMASRLPAVQAAAAALLQLILRNGYEVAQGYFASQVLAQSVSPSSSKINNQSGGSRKGVSSERLGRPGSQTGVALARLLGTASRCG
ncbi:hypothetical protein CRE_15603 [Caenorhabditis remanei]|uniref:PH domain-containing protein n=1 Tax=Caenorhabditis remanei TaxID=31234 RepID=E3N2L8_CAERE|nr:hypothetical protein CRE_15603 [Caenorhabditis remanei]